MRRHSKQHGRGAHQACTVTWICFGASTASVEIKGVTVPPQELGLIQRYWLHCAGGISCSSARAPQAKQHSPAWSGRPNLSEVHLSHLRGGAVRHKQRRDIRLQSHMNIYTHAKKSTQTQHKHTQRKGFAQRIVSHVVSGAVLVRPADELPGSSLRTRHQTTLHRTHIDAITLRL